jgi:hypothetical protein
MIVILLAGYESERAINAVFCAHAHPTFVVASAIPYTPTFRNKLFGNVYRAGLSCMLCIQAYTRLSAEPI